MNKSRQKFDAPRISDLVQTDTTKLDRRFLSEVEGQAVLVKEVSFRSSQMGQFIVLICQDGEGNIFTIVTGAKAVIEAIGKVTDKLPVVVVFEQRKSRMGRPYWVVT